MTNPIARYFEYLADFSFEFMNRLPIEREPQTIEVVMSKIRPALDNARGEAVEQIRKLDRPSPQASEKKPAGMNTIGLLADRLTILCIKAWNVEYKQNDPVKAQKIRNDHIKQITDCMSTCVEGNKDLLRKVTKLKSDLSIKSWEESYYGLLSSNILLWEAQEILYLRDINLVQPEELRDYIKWFSYGNIDRNICIECCEEFYW